jgi:hypothetical protein
MTHQEYGWFSPFALLAAAALVLPMSATRAQGASAGIEGTAWLVEDIAGQGVIDRAQSTISFDTSGRVSGSTGCNGFTGAVTLEGNLGTNRYTFKLGTPINIGLGDWKIGKRTLIDINPFAYLFTANTELAAGDSQTQDPLCTLEAHLSRDLNKDIWLSLDTRYFTGGETSVDDVPDDDKVEALSLGGTFGMALTPHMSIQATYAEQVHTTTEDFEARMIRFRFAYVF